ncbi:MAG: hypothetical protein EA397_16370 [Deltaproteobacteria bacterium]|nr:MAG: hypothetical protein EA397_16370 [Deltaproteobacteria bacterium]
MFHRALLLTLALSGCALHAASHLIQSQDAVDRATALDPEDRALYERTQAELWLAEARREAAHSRYKSSVILAERAREHAERAIRRVSDPKASEAVPSSESAGAP